MGRNFGTSLALFTSLLGAQATTYDVRNTTKGSVRGIVNETSYCREWRGVFFAADTGAGQYIDISPKVYSDECMASIVLF